MLGWRPLAEAWLANRSPQESHVSISKCFVTLLWEILSSIESANFMRNLNLCEFVYIRAPFFGQHGQSNYKQPFPDVMVKDAPSFLSGVTTQLKIEECTEYSN